MLPEQELVEFEGGKAHRNCAMYCSFCENYFIRSDYFSVVPSGFPLRDMRHVNDDVWCGECANAYVENNDASRCEGCGNIYDNERMNYSESRDLTMCNRCYNYPIECGECHYEYREGESHECYLEHGSNIYEYSYRPRPKLYGLGTYWLGFELEVEYHDYDSDSENCNEMAGKIRQMLDGRVYCKHDGSLDYGFEIVSHPHTLENYHTEFPWAFLKRLRSNGFQSWDNDNCGFHVHLSLSAFNARTQGETDMHKIRFTKFIYDNQNQVERIAGRKSNEFALFEDKGNVVNKILHGHQNAGRYEVVNVANSKTIEIRIFKGTLRKERLLSNIEFVQAVLEFTRNMKITPKAKPLAWSRFVKFVVDNEAQYPNLNTILDEAFSSERIKENI